MVLAFPSGTVIAAPFDGTGAIDRTAVQNNYDADPGTAQTTIQNLVDRYANDALSYGSIGPIELRTPTFSNRAPNGPPFSICDPS